eukprot:248648_1
MAVDYEVIAVFFLAFLAILMIVILFSMLYKMYCEHILIKSQNKVIKFYRGAYIACITSSIICTTIDCIHGYFAYSDKVTMLSEGDQKFTTIKVSADLWYFIASNLLNIILFGRVYLTFKETLYALSNIKIIVFLVLISTAIIACFVYISFFIIFPNNQKQQDKYGYFPSAVIMFDDVIVSIFLLYLFNSKLRQLISNSINLEGHHESICYSAPNMPIKHDKISTSPCTLTQTPQRHYIQNVQHVIINKKIINNKKSLLPHSIAEQQIRNNSDECSLDTSFVESQQYQSIASNYSSNVERRNSWEDSTNIIANQIQNSGILSPKPLQPIMNEVKTMEQSISKSKHKDDDHSLRSASLITDSVIFGRRRTESGYIKHNKKVSLEHHHIKLIKVMTRHSVLSGFAIMFNQFFFIADCVSLNRYFEENVYRSQSIYVARAMGLIGIVICLYLSTKFNKDIYKTICQLCHICCYKCCVYFTRRNIINNSTITTTTKIEKLIRV